MKFITCLRHLVKTKIHNLKNDFPSMDSISNCSSRLLRIQNSETEAETWLKTIVSDLTIMEKEVETREKDLFKELKSMLKLIQNCVRV